MTELKAIGNQLTHEWSRVVGVERGPHETELSSIAVDGSIYIAGGTKSNLAGKSSRTLQDTYIIKYNSDGSKAWSTIMELPGDDYLKAISVAGDGSIYLAGYSYPVPGRTAGFIHKINRDGSKVWTRIVENAHGLEVESISAAKDGSIYIGGTSYPDHDKVSIYMHQDAFIGKYNSDGTQAWIRLQGSYDEIDLGKEVSPAVDGSAYLLSRTNNYSSTRVNLTKYGKDGSHMWSDDLSSWLTNSSDKGTKISPVSINTAPDGSIYLAANLFVGADGQRNNVISGQRGYGSYDALVLKYNADGSKAWARVLGTSGADMADFVNVANDGLIYVAGKSTEGRFGAGADSASTIFIAKMRDNGDISSLSFIPSRESTFDSIAYNGNMLYIASPYNEPSKSMSRDISISKFNDNVLTFSPNSPPSGSLGIDGKTLSGYIIAANTSAITDADGLGTFAYKWSVKDSKGTWSDVGTNKTLAITADMVGKTLKASVSFKDGKGNAESISSDEVKVDSIDRSIIAAMTPADWEMYVDRYPLTLGVIYNNLIKPSGQSKAAFGESHFINNGQYEGRVLKVTTGKEDLNDYGAYVENYGTTLLDVFRTGVGPTDRGDRKLSLFEWGKWHFETYGKAEGRDVSGGVDWGAIVRNDSRLLSQFTDALRADSKLTAFKWGTLNQSVISTTLGKELAVGSALDDTLQGNRVFGQGGADVVIGSAAADILHGGFGNDIIIGIEQAAAVKDIPGIIPTADSAVVPVRPARDYVYGGPGDDQFVLAKGAWMQIQDFRKGSDLIRLGNYTKAQITLEENLSLGSPSTDFVDTATGQTLATVYGQRAGDFTYAIASRGLANVFV